VAKLGQRGCRERDLSDGRQALVDEPLQPSQRRSFVASLVGIRHQLAAGEGVGE
jgi:hypothetical protein